MVGCSNALVDKVVLSICLFEGISNARKYCEPNSVLSVRVVMEGAEEAHGSVSRAPFHWLHVELDNVHRTGVAPLSAEQCLRVFDEGYKGHNSTATSTGLGMSSIKKAAVAAGGTAVLSTTVEAQGTTHTVLHIRLPADRLEISHVETTAEAADTTSLEEVVATPNAASVMPPDGLFCAALDDSFMSRHILQTLFSKIMNADPQRSCVQGNSEEEQRLFIDVALGRKNSRLEEMAPPHAHADIVVLDQNISETLLGSDIAGQLQAAGYRGLTCVMTGSSVEKMDAISKQSGVDLVLAKGRSLADVAELLLDAHRRKVRPYGSTNATE